MSDVLISMNSISKNYGNNKGVFDVNLELSGGIIGFLGENGAGKTTTIKIIMGMLHPDKGKVNVLGKNVWEDGNYYITKKYIGFLPNDNILFPDLTGKENLEYSSYLKTGDRKWYTRLTENIEDFSLTDALDEPFKAYSTGMKKKLQILNSVIGDPSILLWDEPHNGLDVISNIKMKSFLKQYASKQNRLVFFSSHIIEMVEDICNDVIIIHKGKIVSQIKTQNCSNLTEYYLNTTK